MSKIKEALKVTSEALDQIKHFRQQMINQCVEELNYPFKEVFDNIPGLQKFAIRGYTPEFNDGEECLHRAEIFVGYWQPKENYNKEKMIWDTDIEDEDLVEWFTRSGLEPKTYYDEYTDGDPNPSVNHQCDINSLLELKQSSEIITLIDLLLDTNYTVYIELIDGNVVIKHEHYDCGY